MTAAQFHQNAMTRPNYTKEFLDLISSFGYRFDAREVFRDWSELVAAELHQAPYNQLHWPKDDDWRHVEDDYLAVAKKYERKDFDVFAKMMAVTAIALDDNRQDFLGKCYMQMEVANSRLGQEFTPYEISLMLARLNLDNAREWIDRVGFFTLMEPTCGAGSMIIAASQIVEEEPINGNPSYDMWFEAIDIDRLCCNLTYIQCSLLDLSGIVWHGNTMSMEMKSFRLTPAARVHPQRTQRMIAYTRGKWEPEAALPATGLVQLPMILEV